MPAIVGIFVLVVVSLQLFLLMVGLDAFITYDGRLARAAALTSVVLAACAASLYRSVRGPRRVSALRARR